MWYTDNIRLESHSCNCQFDKHFEREARYPNFYLAFFFFNGIIVKEMLSLQLQDFNNRSRLESFYSPYPFLNFLNKLLKLVGIGK